MRDHTGRTYRWKVTSLAFKAERDAAGVEATWVVGAPVAEAIAVLERLQPADTEWLFAHLTTQPGYGPASVGCSSILSAGATNNQLHNLAEWINDYCARHGRADHLPAVNGQRWTLSTRQFRRTLAWFVARRPGGTIAGAIQYRHLGVQMFEGYAGL